MTEMSPWLQKRVRIDAPASLLQRIETAFEVFDSWYPNGAPPTTDPPCDCCVEVFHALGGAKETPQ